MNNNYTIVFDDGKPFEVKVKGEKKLKKALKKFYLDHKDSDGYFDSKVYNSEGDDITYSNFIDSIVREFLDE